MSPGRELPVSLSDGRLIPHFLTPADKPWLRALLDEYERFAGRPRRELVERLKRPLPVESPERKRWLASSVLDRLVRSGVPAGPSPRLVRRHAFLAASAPDASRATALDAAARELGVAPADIEAALFADLGDERLLSMGPAWPGLDELVLRVNLALAQALIFRATSVVIELSGNARRVVGQAKLSGLICSVAPRTQGCDAELTISGPFALFRKTLVYGRRLGELLPLLVWCRSFRLRATCALRHGDATLILRSGDPLFPSVEPRRYDSKLEERFARSFARLAIDWDIVREPEPIAAAGRIIFPDFELRHRADPARRWLLELVGFWTPDYIERKLAHLRAARLDRFILCVDSSLNCAADELPAGASIVRFERSLKAESVLAVIEAESGRHVDAEGLATAPHRLWGAGE